MIMSPCKGNRNDLIGIIAAGGEHGRETTNGTEGIVEGKTDGNGESGENAVEDGSAGVESELPTREADLCGIVGRETETADIPKPAGTAGLFWGVVTI
jgi:hypothetical protein